MIEHMFDPLEDGAPRVGAHADGMAPSAREVGREVELVVPLTLDERRDLAHALVDRVFRDPAAASGDELGDVLVARADLATVVDGTALRSLPGWEARGAWRNDGCASASAWLVGHTGARRAAVASLPRCAHDVGELAALEDAALSGLVSLEHLRLCAGLRRRRPEVRTLFDRDVEELLAAATRMHADAYARHLELWYHQALAELAENEPDTPPDGLSDESTLHLHRSFQGRALLTGELTVEHHAALLEALDARIARWQRDGQLDDDPRPLDQLRAAALMELVAEAAVANRRGHARPLLIVTATLAALLERARIGPGERDRWRAEILGGGPIGQRALRDLLERANLQLVVTDDDGHPLHVGRTRRLATAAMYAALIAMTGGTCEHPTCSAPHHRCHAHHLTWWSHGGATSLENLALLCPHHHRLIHTGATSVHRRSDGTLHWSRPDGAPLHPPPFTDAA